VQRRTKAEQHQAAGESDQVGRAGTGVRQVVVTVFGAFLAAVVVVIGVDVDGEPDRAGLTRGDVVDRLRGDDGALTRRKVLLGLVLPVALVVDRGLTLEGEVVTAGDRQVDRGTGDTRTAEDRSGRRGGVAVLRLADGRSVDRDDDADLSGLRHDDVADRLLSGDRRVAVGQLGDRGGPVALV